MLFLSSYLYGNLPAILNPVWAIRSPLQALLAIGSMKHIIVGCIIESVYIVWKSKRSNFASYFT